MDVCRSLVKMTGCWHSNGIAALLSQPPTWRISPAITGSSLYSRLSLGMFLQPPFSEAISLLNLCFCTNWIIDWSALARSSGVRSYEFSFPLPILESGDCPF